MVFLVMFAPKSKAKQITEKITYLFCEDKSVTDIFRYDIVFGLSIMIRKYFGLTEKGKELLKLIEPEIDKSRLKDVIDFEVDYVKKSYEKELADMGDALAEKDIAIANKDDEICRLMDKLKENGIE